MYMYIITTSPPLTPSYWTKPPSPLSPFFRGPIQAFANNVSQEAQLHFLGAYVVQQACQVTTKEGMEKQLGYTYLGPLN